MGAVVFLDSDWKLRTSILRESFFDWKTHRDLKLTGVKIYDFNAVDI